MSDESKGRPTAIDAEVCRPMRRPIAEEWLRANGFQIEDGRNDPRLPVRSLAIGSDFIGGRPFLGSSDDLCIDVSPRGPNHPGRHVWIARREPYRHIHARTMAETWELIRLYEALTGRAWPGTRG